MTDVFISYAQHDRETASSLASYLESNGLTVWWDFLLVGGANFRSEIHNALDKSTAVVVIWSDASVASEFVLDEAEQAKDYDKLITTRLPGFDAKRAPLGFRQRQCYSVTNREQIMRALLDRFGLGDGAHAESVQPHLNELIARGRDHLEFGDIDQAIIDLSEAILLQPNDAELYIDRGYAYRNKDDNASAVEDFGKAIDLRPNDAKNYVHRGIAFLEMNDYDRAIADLDKGIEMDPSDAVACSARGQAYHGKQDYDRAIADFNRAIELDPSYAMAYHSRGLSYFQRNDYDRAIADYDKALELYPNYPNAIYDSVVAQRARDGQQ